MHFRIYKFSPIPSPCNKKYFSKNIITINFYSITYLLGRNTFILYKVIHIYGEKIKQEKKEQSRKREVREKEWEKYRSWNTMDFSMVFILDGCSFHVAHVWCKQGLFFEKKIEFDDSFDVTKCLQQIEMPDLLHVCA